MSWQIHYRPITKCRKSFVRILYRKTTTLHELFHIAHPLKST